MGLIIVAVPGLLPSESSTIIIASWFPPGPRKTGRHFPILIRLESQNCTQDTGEMRNLINKKYWEM